MACFSRPEKLDNFTRDMICVRYPLGQLTIVGCLKSRFGAAELSGADIQCAIFPAQLADPFAGLFLCCSRPFEGAYFGFRFLHCCSLRNTLIDWRLGEGGVNG